MAYFKKFCTVFQWLCLLGLFGLYLYFLFSNTLIDFDCAGEMIMAKFLADENSLISPNFVYGNEIRVFSQNLTCPILFKFFDDWYFVMALSNVIWMLSLFASFYYLTAQTNCKHYFPIAAAFFLIPYNGDYIINIIFWPCYIPFLVLTFLSVGLVFQYSNADSHKRKFLLPFMFLVPFVGCLGGYRLLLVTYIPFLCILGLLLHKSQNEDFKIYWQAIVIQFVSGVIGLFVNHNILSHIYTFHNYDTAVWLNTFNNEILGNLERTIHCLLVGSGYYSEELVSKSTISNLVCLPVLFLILIHSFKVLNKDKIDVQKHFLVLLYIFALAIFCFLNFFFNFNMEPRHIFPITMLSIPIIAIALKDFDYRLKIALSLIFIVLAVNSGSYYLTKRYGTFPEVHLEQRNFYNVLLDNECYQGYTTWPNGNVLTMITNGKIKTFNIDYGGYEEHGYLDFRNHLYQHVQTKDTFTKKPEGKIFLLLTKDEYEKEPIFKKHLKRKKAVYESDMYYLFIFKNIDVMLKELGKDAKYDYNPN